MNTHKEQKVKGKVHIKSTHKDTRVKYDTH